MIGVIDFLAAHGAMLLSGSTLLLALGALAVACRRAPIERQRLAELSLIAVLAWAALAISPLPRRHRAGPPVTPPIPAKISVGRSIDAARHPTTPPPARARLRSPLAEQTAEALGGGRTTHRRTDAAAAADWPRRLAVVYLIGAASGVAWLALCRVLLANVVRRSKPPEAWLAEIFAGLKAPRDPSPALRIAPRGRLAYSCGLWRPVIVLPGRLCGQERADALRHVLLHELSHVRQRDAWGHLLFNLMLPWLYFHPFYWWLRAVSRASRETIADDWAARHSSPEVYAAHLVGLARELASRWPAHWTALAVLGSSSQFYRRMTMLLKRRNALATRCSRGWKIVSLTCAALVVAGAAWRLGIEPAAAQVEQSKIKIEIGKTRVSEKTTHQAGEEQATGDSLVTFYGPEGARVRWRSGPPDKSVDHILTLAIPRGNVRFRQGAVHQLQLSNLPGRDGVVLYPTLETRRSLPASEEFLKHSAIPIQFAEEDFDQALAGNLVTKVIYLPDAEHHEVALSGVETLVSTRVKPGVDPVAEAERKGTMLAILRMGNAVAPLKVDAVGATAIESPHASTGVLQAAASVGVEESDEADAGAPSSRRVGRMRLGTSQLDLVEWIGAYSDAVRDAETLAFDVELHVNAEKTTPGVTPAAELRRMRAQKKAAERKVSLLVRLMKGEIAAAKAELHAAMRDLAMLEKAEKEVALSHRAARDARRRYETAQAEVELLESLLSEASRDQD